MAYQAGTGMAGFDEQDAQDAADALAKMGQPAPDAPATQPPPMVPGAPAPDVSAPAGGVSATPVPPDVSEPPAPTPAPGPTTDAAATAETPAETGAKAVAELGPPPQRPKYTGDPTKDVQINVEWQRQLTDYSTALARKQGEIAKQDADITQRKAEREADAERASQAARQAEVDAYQQQRQARQQQIDDAVKEKASALSDLKHGGEHSFLDDIGAAVAIALGGIGQGLMLKGHVQGAQNEGLNAVNKRIADEDQRRKDRLKAASDAVLEARYGFKDAADNHRAGLNDIDTERAAKYRLIASEAEEQLRAQGATDQDIKTNAVVADALQNAAKAEGAIHEREETTQVHRETAAATNKLAEAHLNLAERQAKATEDQRHETNFEHRREFDLREKDRADAAAAAAAAKKDKQKDADEKEIVRDEQGKPIARVPSGRGGAQAFATRDADYGRADQQMQALIDDIKTNGARPLTPEAIRRRQTLEENAKIAVATVSPLGKTNEAMEAEGASIGAHGSGLMAAVKDVALGSNLEAVQRKATELRDQRNKYRQETLRPLGDEPVPQAHTAEKPAHKGVEQPAGGGNATPKAPNAMRAAAERVSNDPKAPQGARDRAAAYLHAHPEE